MSGSGSTYSIRVLTQRGHHVGNLSALTNFSYARSLNAPGTLTMQFATHSVDKGLIADNTRLEVWRTIGDRTYLDTNTTWIVNRVVRKIDENGSDIQDIRAVSAMGLLGHRIIAYAPGHAAATINGIADNMMKRIVRENFGSSAGTDRDISMYLSVDPDTGRGITLEKQIGWRSVLPTLQEIARDSDTEGSPLYFDVVNGGSTGLVFRTWTDQPGTDRSYGERRFLISMDSGALRSIEYGLDLQNAVTVMYALGQEKFGVRHVEDAEDSSGLIAGPFSRREGTIEARGAETSPQLLAEASSALAKARPKRSVVASLADTKLARYGVDWNYGDRLVIQVDGVVYSCIVESVSVQVRQNGQEQIQANLKFD